MKGSIVLSLISGIAGCSILGYSLYGWHKVNYGYKRKYHNIEYDIDYGLIVDAVNVEIIEES